MSWDGIKLIWKLSLFSDRNPVQNIIVLVVLVSQITEVISYNFNTCTSKMYTETLKFVVWSCNNISQNLEYIFLDFKLIQMYFSDWFDIKEYSEITT